MRFGESRASPSGSLYDLAAWVVRSISRTAVVLHRGGCPCGVERGFLGNVFAQTELSDTNTRGVFDICYLDNFKFRARINTATLENRRNGCGVNTVVGLTDAAGRRLSVALTCFVIGAMLELRTMPRQGAQPRRSAVAEHAGAGPGELTKQNGTPPAAHRRWVDAAAPGPGSAPLDGHVAGPATQSSCQSLKIRPRG